MPAVVRAGPDDQIALLLVEERGRDLEWRFEGDDAFRPIGVRPPRLGLAAVPIGRSAAVQIRAYGANPEPAPVRLELLCRPGEEQLALAACLSVAENVDGSASAIQLFLETPSDTCRAFLLHAAAASASSRGDTRDAELLYRAAVSMWSRIGDSARRGAAEIGWSERLSDLGRYDAAIAAAEEARQHSRAAGIGYFAARAQSQRCIATSYVRSPDLAMACYERLAGDFLALGEASEAANAHYNLASIAEEVGRLDTAREHVERAFALGDVRISPLVIGRLRYLEGRLALAQGRIVDALAALDRSLDAVERAGNRRWQANVYLLTAHLYASLSANDEAALFLDRARAYYRDTETLPRLAAAIEFEARLRLERGQREAARAAATEAAERFTALGMTGKSIDAWLLAIRAGAGESAWRSLEAAIAAQAPVPERLRIDLELARAHAAVANADRAEAGALASRLDVLAQQATSMDQLLWARRLQVRALLGAGDAQAALRTVDRLLDRQLALVQSLRVPALRHLAIRHARRIGALWIDAVLTMPADRQPSAETIRHRLLALQGGRVLAPRPGDVRSADDALDEVLARALLSGSDEKSTSAMLQAQRSLLRFYSHPADAAIDASARTNASGALDDPVPDDVVRLSFGLGDERALALVAHGHEAAVHEIAAPELVREAVAELVALAHRRESPLGALDDAARTLSRLLFPTRLGAAAAPAQLWIESDETLAAVPFALLPWPGSDRPLVESTAISQRIGADGRLEPARAVDVLVAAEPAGADAMTLPRLHGAEFESGLLAAALEEVSVRMHTGADAGRERLESLLARRDAWLHVAAHGISQPGIQGLAGLWLTPAGGASQPDFVSWLSLADRPLAASLVVLNACQLAQTGAAVSASASFASALAAAGVNHVVAARWQVSDSATAVWVPAFYGALRTDPEQSPALAVRQAQLALRRSRVFRHPFYWAGLSHTQGIDSADP